MNRFSLIDPYTIANTCSPRHTQSVLEGMKKEIATKDTQIQELQKQVNDLQRWAWGKCESYE